MKKTIFDAVDGYHAIPLDEASKSLAKFIMEWERYRCNWLPQGYIAAEDAYIQRYNEIIKDIPRKVKYFDDALLWDYDIENAFYHTRDYLTLCANKGSFIDKEEFQFCRDEGLFPRLKINKTGLAPSDHILSTIQDFSTHKELQMPDHSLDSLIKLLGLIQLAHLWNLFGIWLDQTLNFIGTIDLIKYLSNPKNC